VAVTKEVFANVASCIASGSSGTTTSDTSWTMSTGYTSFPAASTSTTPQTYFYVTDPADTGHEIIQVTNTSGTSWTVVRGALGSTAVAHASGATYVQVVSHGTLQNFKQAPSAAVSPVTVATTTETVVATYQPTTDEIIAGATWEIVAFGVFVTSHNTQANRQMVWTVRWGGSGGTILCQLKTNSNAASMATTVATGSSFDLNGSVTLIDSTHATCNLNLFANNATNFTSAQLTAQATNATGGAASSNTSVTISGSGPLVLDFAWGATVTNQTLTVTAPLIYRAA